jgi:hypothetical protein
VDADRARLGAVGELREVGPFKAHAACAATQKTQPDQSPSHSPTRTVRTPLRLLTIHPGNVSWVRRAKTATTFFAIFPEKEIA